MNDVTLTKAWRMVAHVGVPLLGGVKNLRRSRSKKMASRSYATPPKGGTRTFAMLAWGKFGETSATVLSP
jgi:Mrp family chromosome partitioning ATPase